ncbi:MAG TPA: hypothetical protein PLE19_07765 [Planctomycetota bacterium]|nr:hypothetical protein [Planctomycetota bacterium]HRR78920.1 hypothetical protein [Planctomycetota bacterium]HRT92802.1 hypothetical protein [Planctomycetota bacterium]
MKTTRPQSLMALACIGAYVLMAQVELVLCVSADGRVALEAAACGCCDQCADSAASPLQRAPQPTVARGKGSCSFCCVDTAVHVNGVAVQPSAGHSSKLHERAPAASALAVPPAGVTPAAAVPASHAPPPNAGFQSLQTVVLRI